MNKVTRIVRELLFVGAAVCAFAAEPALAQTGKFTDKRDGKVYKTVKMPGGKTWMAENLNVKTGTSWCYGNQESNCKKYGRLYAWSTALKMACPDGWRLPSSEEWIDMAKAAADEEPGKALKSKSGWYEDGGGTDKFGFSALPGGKRNADGEFDDAELYGNWWAVIDDGSKGPYGIYMYYSDEYVSGNGDVSLGAADKATGFSVRCIVD
ncbi:hypothetical protein R80B4_03292 [Fibrobacteres bacterium R8-0-B4]